MTEIFVTYAFSKDNSGGNPAGVVLDSDLTYKEKLSLANMLGFSETAFLSGSGRADFKLEYFTPTEEVPLCGHATIAAFITLQNLGVLEKTCYSIETQAGILEISIHQDGLVFMEQNSPIFYEVLDKSVLNDCFNTDFVDAKLPVQIVSTGLKDILVPIDSQVHLSEIVPNLKAISAVSSEKGAVGIHAFTLLREKGITALCRNFAPLYGINEESATGTSNCALACYLYKNGCRQEQYVFEQGHSLGHISRILVHIKSENDRIKKVYVGGYGYIKYTYGRRYICHDDISEENPFRKRMGKCKEEGDCFPEETSGEEGDSPEPEIG